MYVTKCYNQFGFFSVHFSISFRCGSMFWHWVQGSTRGTGAPGIWGIITVTSILIEQFNNEFNNVHIYMLCILGRGRRDACPPLYKKKIHLKNIDARGHTPFSLKTFPESSVNYDISPKKIWLLSINKLREGCVKRRNNTFYYPHVLLCWFFNLKSPFKIIWLKIVYIINIACFENL